VTLDKFREQFVRLFGSLDDIIECQMMSILPEFQRLGCGLKFIGLGHRIADDQQANVAGFASAPGAPVYLKGQAWIVGHVKLEERELPDADGSVTRLQELEVPIMRRRYQSAAHV
jgi:hypothetical protein